MTEGSRPSILVRPPHPPYTAREAPAVNPPLGPNPRSRMKARIAASVVVGLLSVNMLAADDWPQFRGPKRDGHSADKGLLKKWPEGGPKLAWTFDKTGVGYSGPAVVGDKLYIM